MRKKIEKLLNCLASPSYAHALLRHSVAAAVEHESVLRDLPFFEAIVDVGANKGQFALVARKVFPSASITSFEPLEGPASRFLEIFRKDPRISLRQVAISDRSGFAEMHISAKEDSSSLHPIGLQERVFPGTHEVACRKVRVAKLAEVLPSPLPKASLLKIDVQGYELEVLKGSSDLLGCFSHIYVECSFAELYSGQALAGEVINWLSARGFVLIGEFNPYVHAGRVVQCDMLFSTAEER